ncbi:MAG: bifunctional DNA-formamidopyrimidine glycosylase/DNA-(apurinic or apyrimidinic site) lyase [Candidatus Saccharimonas sp.]
MPELPEVETVRRGLERLIIGRTVTSVRCLDSPKSFPNDPAEVAAQLIGADIVAVRRRAKVLLIDLSTNYTLVTHLKMTGQIVWLAQSTPTNMTDPSSRFGAGHPNDSLVGELPDRSTRVVYEFSDGSHLYFNDQRKFGWMKLYPTPEVSNIDFMKKVGPEPLELEFSHADFVQRIRRRNNTTIKAAILDQTVIAGVGNIYADESLWGTKLRPATRVRDIADETLGQLLEEIRTVMVIAIEKGGSTDKNYVNAEGKKGSYIDFARVFRREGLDCPRCGAMIEKIRCAGRGTHVCPVCQRSA